MLNNALKTSNLLNGRVAGVLDWICLDTGDLKCLEMALYFLSMQLNKVKANVRFLNFHDYRLRYMNDWLYDGRLRSALRCDGLNFAVWPVIDMEDMKWFVMALEFGITEEVIVSMASDDASYERDMAVMGGDDIDFENRYCAFHNYYCGIARRKSLLLAKLKNILNNHHKT